MAPNEKPPGRLATWPLGQQTPVAWPTPPAPAADLWVYDVEVFPNCFMFSAFNGTDWLEFDERSLWRLADFVSKPDRALAGFNNHGYDDVIIGDLAACKWMRNPAKIYELSCRLIDPKDDKEKDKNFRARYKSRPWAYSIDVFQILNAKGALKEWECRIGYDTIAESPADFDKPLPPEMVEAVRQYCRNDVMATAKILTDRWPLVGLRTALAEAFGLGERGYCLSEQGLAQATILTLHRMRTRETSGKVRTKAAQAPENAVDRIPLAELASPKVAFETAEGKAAWATLAGAELVKAESWSIPAAGEPFALGGVKVSVGVGGLHSVDAPGTVMATLERAIVDLDVTSYYPSLIISEKVFPSQLGEDFCSDMATLRAQRVAAKKAGDKITADALKIVLNATYGKLNDNWSPIRSVKNAFRVTINGQLFLMMLIERLSVEGIEVLSANTDGVTVALPRAAISSTLARVTSRWQSDTGMELESAMFAQISRRDVNTYAALTEDGKVKLKGDLNPEAGKADGQVIVRAAVEYLLKGTDPAETVGKETDPRAFLFYQRCKNGGELVIDEQVIGKTVRWYVTTDGQTIKRKNPNGTFATLPNGHKIALAQDITGWTVDGMAGLDRAYYVAAAWDLINTTKATSA